MIGWGFCDIQNNRGQGRVVIGSWNLEIMHHGHNDYCIICSYDVTGAISKTHCKLLANQKRDSELNV